MIFKNVLRMGAVVGIFIVAAPAAHAEATHAAALLGAAAVGGVPQTSYKSRPVADVKKDFDAMETKITAGRSTFLKNKKLQAENVKTIADNFDVGTGSSMPVVCHSIQRIGAVSHDKTIYGSFKFDGEGTSWSIRGQAGDFMFGKWELEAYVADGTGDNGFHMNGTRSDRREVKDGVVEFESKWTSKTDQKTMQKTTMTITPTADKPSALHSATLSYGVRIHSEGPKGTWDVVCL